MKYRLLIILATVALVATSITPALAEIPPAQPNTCGLATPAFCETFSTSGGGASRSGDLPEYWGVSRWIGGGSNFGQGQANSWANTDIALCNGTEHVSAGRDVRICNGQLREATNDYGDVTVLAMYPKQPFDFAGRTGKITFDVSNDTLSMHTFWPEVWVTDQPVPAPFTHLASWYAAPRFGFGLRLGASGAPGQGGNLGPNCPSDQNHRWGVDSVVVSRNYAFDDSTDAGHTVDVQHTGCVIASSGPNGGLNHVEIRVSESRLEVWATDAGATQLKQIAIVDNARLGFTRGLVWIEDGHYNAEKFGGAAQHTFTWDNVGFDGPVLDRDVTFDEPDAMVPYPGDRMNLGYNVAPNQRRTFNLPPLNSVAKAKAAFLLVNWFVQPVPATLTYVVNGTVHTVPYPFPGNAGNPRTFAFPVPLSEIHDGANTISFGATNAAMVVGNAGLVLAGVSGGAVTPPTNTPVPPTATAVPPTATSPVPAATNTPVPAATPTNTAVPAAQCWVQVSNDGVTFTPRRITDQSLAAALCG